MVTSIYYLLRCLLLGDFWIAELLNIDPVVIGRNTPQWPRQGFQPSIPHSEVGAIRQYERFTGHYLVDGTSWYLSRTVGASVPIDQASYSILLMGISKDQQRISKRSASNQQGSDKIVHEQNAAYYSNFLQQWRCPCLCLLLLSFFSPGESPYLNLHVCACILKLALRGSEIRPGINLLSSSLHVFTSVVSVPTEGHQ